MSNIIPISFDSYLGYANTANVESQMGGVNPDPAVNSRVQNIGKRLTPHTENKNLPYAFKPLNTNTVNAFALPGGPVYVTNGLLNITDNDDELASVIGHEIGHVNARHGIKSMELSLGAGIIEKAVRGLLAKGGASADQLSAIKDVNNTIIKFAALGYSRENEYESDAKALKYAVSAGYNPYGMVGFMEKLQALEGRKITNLEEFFSTHPSTTKRISEINAIIAKNYPDAKPLTAPLVSPSQITTLLKKPIILWPVIGLGALGLGYAAYRMFRKPQITQIRGNPLIREPHVMTRREYLKLVTPKTTRLTLMARYIDETGKKIETEADILSVKRKYPHEWDIMEIKEKLAKEIYLMIPAELRATGLFGINALNLMHERFVEWALQAGELVPDRVLADYPHLKKYAEEQRLKRLLEPQIPKELEPLAVEARKYKTAEEFRESLKYQTGKGPRKAELLGKYGYAIETEKFGTQPDIERFYAQSTGKKTSNFQPLTSNIPVAQATRPNPRIPAALMPLIKEASKYSHHEFWDAIKSGKFDKFRKELDMAYDKYGSIDMVWSLSRRRNPQDEIFIKPRRARGKTAEGREIADIPDRVGYIKVFMPYGSQGKGYYYVKDIARETSNFQPLTSNVSVAQATGKKTSNPIPSFRSTQEAMAYGRSIAGKTDKINQLRQARLQTLEVISDMKKAPEPDYDKLMALATSAQFYREAIESVKPNTGLAKKLLTAAVIIPVIPPL